MYKIRGADQKEYGPVSADTIRQWISERRANAQTLLQAEGGPWQPLAQFPEFAPSLPVSPPPIAGPPPISGGPAVRPPSSGLAVTSLVLGVVSIACFGLLTGIPAIITGHIAHRRTRSGLAVAGLVMGYLSILTSFVLAGMLLPALSKAKSRAQTIACVNHMKQIGLAAQMWATDHNNAFPSDLASFAKYLPSPKILICPSDSSKTPATDAASVGPENISYELTFPEEKSPGDTQKSLEGASNTVFLRCLIHGNVGYADGSVRQRERGVSTY